LLLRNFAIQHLEIYAGALDARGCYDAASPVAAQIRSTQGAAAQETSSSIGGTALLCLERLSRVDGNVDRAAISSQAAQCAASDSADIQSRIAAVQLCGKMCAQSSVPALRAIVVDPTSATLSGSPPAMRLAS
jgi:hypothetical protein